ncbi:MAG: transcription antitermination factor NusB [Pseudomonadota bacterium]
MALPTGESGPDDPVAAPRGPAGGRRERSAARLAAVQALYQMEIASRGADSVIREFVDHRFEAGEDDVVSGAADDAFFAEIVRGVAEGQGDVDPAIQAHLATNWRLSRLDSILRAILRAGAFEIWARPDVPARVAIDEYVDVGHAFFEGEEPGVINGVLDALARERRPEEFAGARDGR